MSVANTLVTYTTNIPQGSDTSDITYLSRCNIWSLLLVRLWVQSVVVKSGIKTMNKPINKKTAAATTTTTTTTTANNNNNNNKHFMSLSSRIAS